MEYLSMAETGDPEMAEQFSIIEVNCSDEEDILRDSLESIEESFVSQTIGDEIESAETMKEINAGSQVIHHGNMKLSRNPETTKVRNSDDKRKKQLLKPCQRDIIEINKTNVLKGRPKGSYSKMYRTRQQFESQRTPKAPEQKGGDNVRRSDEPESQSEQQATDVIDKYQSQTFSIDDCGRNINQSLPGNPGNYGYNHSYAGLQLNENIHKNVFDHGSNEMDSKPLGGNSERRNVSQIKQGNISQPLMAHALSTTNMASFNNDCNGDGMYKSLNNNGFYKEQDVHTQLHLGNVSSYHQYLPPISEDFNLIWSAPAGIETYHSNPGNLQCEMSYRPSSLCTMTAQNTPTITKDAKRVLGTTSYSSIYAKQHTYEPYTLSDYKRLKQSGASSGGLGPDTNNKQFKEKAKKTARQKEYAAIVREKHSLDKSQWKKNPISQGRSPKLQEANDRRNKALQYAKAVPKPSIARKEVSQVKAEVNQHEPQTVLDVLRQRHEKERKAIDAVRKDFETKLKPR